MSHRENSFGQLNFSSTMKKNLMMKKKITRMRTMQMISCP